MTIPPLTREQVRRVDRIAIETFGIPGVVLMENAGRSAAEAILKLWRSLPVQDGRDVVVLCGGGGNGGDGYVIARHLQIALKNERAKRDGAGSPQVSIIAVKEPASLTGDAAVFAEVARRMGLEIHLALSPEAVQAQAGRLAAAGLLVDAMLGTGFRGPVRPPVSTMIELCNQWREADRGRSKDGRPHRLVVAIDLPSGLDADTGEPAVPGGEAIEADLTVTFVAEKVGFARPGAARYLGKVVVGEIGAPAEVVERARGEG